MVDVIYDASLDAKDVLKELTRIQKQIAKTAGIGDEHFQKIGKSAELSGDRLGAVIGVVSELTRSFINLGQQAISTFGSIVARGVEMNTTLETAGRVFGAAFGDPKLGQATLDFLDQVSEKLNIDQAQATLFAQTILPKTGSLDEFTELLRLTDIQADSTGQTISELEFSIREALSGDFVSLKDRFDIGKGQIDEIKRLTPEIGRAQAIIKVLSDDFERLGKVNIQGTLATDAKAIQAEFNDLNRALSAPVFEELKELFVELGSILDERGDDFELIADAFGRVAAKVTDLVGSGLADFLANLDTDEMIELSENLFSMVSDAQILVETLGLMELPGDLITGVKDLTGSLSEALETAVKISGLARAEAARQAAIGESVAETIREQGGIEFSAAAAENIPGLAGLVVGASKALGIDEEGTAAAEAAGQEAFNKSILETNELITQSTQRKEENAAATEKLREEQQKTTGAGEEAIDTLLREQAAADQAAAAQEELADALETVGDKLVEIEKDIGQRRADALSKANNQRSKIERNFSRSREKDERVLQRKLSDIEAEAADEKSKKSVQVALDASKKRVDIESDFQNEIAAINARALDSQEESARSRDAISFLRAERERQRALKSASVQRGQDIRQVNTEEGRAQQELATIDNALQQKLDKERQNFEVRRIEAGIAQQERLDDLDIGLLEEDARIDTAQQRKLEKLQMKSQEEIAIIEAATGQQINLVQNAEAAKTAIVRAQSAQRIALLQAEAAAAQEARRRQIVENESEARRAVARRSVTRRRRPPTRRRFPRRQFGGPVIGGQTVAVGESGIEAFTAPVSGSILPNSRIGQLPLSPNINNTTSIDNSIRAEVNQSMLDPAQQSMIMRQIARNEAKRLLDNVIGRR